MDTRSVPPLLLLDEANQLLGDRDALEGAFARDGYLFFRDVLDRAAVATVAAGVIDFLAGEGIAEGVGDEPTWTGRDATPLGAHPPALHQRRLWEALMADPTTVGFMTMLFGEAPLPIPIAQYQFKTPGQVEPALRSAHQDHFYNPGLHFRTFWIPLVDIDEALGGLTLAAGCHTNGFLHDTSHSGLSPLIDGAVPAEAWRRADYHPGDVVVFHGATPHGGLPNHHPRRLRLSVDMRAQPVSAPAPAIGVVTGVEGQRITVTADDGHQTSMTIDQSTVIRTDMAVAVDAQLLLGHRVIAAGDDGRAVLVRSAA